jgi:predicted nucleotidyltransferase
MSNLIRFEHPISDAVRARVLAELQSVEKTHDVRVVFACESGSRDWGFASPDSDYDVRFVYVHKLEWYLRVESQRDVIELPISDELDVSGWELRKALGLMRRSNPPLFEWLDSPVIYREDKAVATQLRGFASSFFSEKKGCAHYMAMAKTNFRGYLQGPTVRLKKYLYVLRPLLAAMWIQSGRGLPPMRFAELAEAMVEDASLRDEINQLLAFKMSAGEAEHGPRYPRIHAFVEERLAIDENFAAAKESVGETAILDKLLFEVVQQSQ